MKVGAARAWRAPAVLAALCASGCSLAFPFDEFGSGGSASSSSSSSGSVASSAGGSGGVGGSPAGTGGSAAGNGGQGGVATSAYASAVLEDGPLAWWRLGEEAGSEMVVDATGNGHHGVIIGTVIAGVPGALVGDADTAFELEGASYLEVGDEFDFTAEDDGGAFSLEAWIEPDVTVTRAVASKETSNGDDGYFFTVSSEGLHMVRRVGGQSEGASSVGLPARPGYMHVVATYDGGTQVLYVNGTSVISNLDSQALAGHSDPFVIGARRAGGTDLFVGSIDEVAVYGKALSGTRVKAHYDAGTGGR